jgi:hypothetical protein
LKLFDQAHINICDDSINDDVFVNLEKEAENQNEDEPIARTESTSSGFPADDEIQTFETVEAEITHLNTELNQMTFTNPVSLAQTSVNTCPTDFTVNWEDEDSLYLLGVKKLFEDFKIRLGSFDVPRFSCACHKLNIVIQSAIENQKHLQEVIRTLSSLASKICTSIGMAAIFNLLK